MGPKTAAPPGIFLFGDFELDVRAYELRSAGIPLKLKPIPLKLLLFLVERRGEMITRQEIVERIWGKDVFLDTDNSINGAISKLRQVLRDDAEQPRFVQTVTGQGYRFIAPVQTSGVSLELVKSEEETPAAGESGLGETTPSWERSGRGLWALVLAAAIILVATTAYLRWSRPQHQSRAVAGRTMLAVLPFENLTGDPGEDYFSDGLTEEMITQLGRINAERLGVIARTSVMHYKHTGEQLSQIGRELGVQYVLEGSVRRDAGKVRITAQLIQVKDQTHLWAQEYDRDPKDLLILQSEIARRIADEIQGMLGDHAGDILANQPALSPQTYEA